MLFLSFSFDHTLALSLSLSLAAHNRCQFVSSTNFYVTIRTRICYSSYLLLSRFILVAKNGIHGNLFRGKELKLNIFKLGILKRKGKWIFLNLISLKFWRGKEEVSQDSRKRLSKKLFLRNEKNYRKFIE